MADVERDEKTEEATPRRRQESREKGQVALSSEFIAAVTLVAAFALLAFSGRRLAEAAGGLLVQSLNDFGRWGTQDIDYVVASNLVGAAWDQLIFPFAMMVLPILVIGAVVGYGQVGFQIAPKAVSPDLSKLNPAKGMSKIFSMRSFVRTLLAASKITVIALTMGVIAWYQIPKLTSLVGLDIGPVLLALVSVAMRCTIGALIAIVLLSLLDLMFQRQQHEKDMRMSKKEIKEEMKSTEGDPHLKARIRQMQRDLATRRMMDDVPDATVVVTNPTHYAVALRYEQDSDASQGRAPICVAKGVDHVAQRIKKVASDAGVILYEDVPLARALHAQVEIGDQIPEDLYQAVAEVLSYVYRLRGKSALARR